MKLTFENHDLTNFTFTLFARKYEYLIINNGNGIKKDVPYQSLVSKDLNEKLKTIHYSKTKNILKNELNKKTAYDNEVKRRFIIHNNKPIKAKWAGLQGAMN